MSLSDDKTKEVKKKKVKRKQKKQRKRELACRERKKNYEMAFSQFIFKL